MLLHAVPSAADPDVAWALLSQPARWREWSPHVRGAWGLGEPEVERSSRGAARLFGFFPLPVRVSAVEHTALTSHWGWSVGPVAFDHAVRRDREGCTISISCEAPRPLEATIKHTYWRFAARSIDRLATRAEDVRLADVPEPLHVVEDERRHALR